MIFVSLWTEDPALDVRVQHFKAHNVTITGIPVKNHHVTFSHLKTIGKFLIHLFTITNGNCKNLIIHNIQHGSQRVP
jgi:hypothetical protein